MLRVKLIIFFLSSISFSVAAQEKLTLQQAIDLGLKNGYSITIAKSEQEIAYNNYKLGRASFLPEVNLNASGTFTDYNTQQSYASGLEINRPSVKSNNINTSAGASWTVFDGMKMFATYGKLKELRDMGEIAGKIEIENGIARIMTSYYTVVKEQEILEAITKIISTYDERVKITERKFNIGSGAKPDFLQAKIDLNTQKSNLLRQQVTLSKAKIELNTLIGLAADKEYILEDSIQVTLGPSYEDMKNSLTKSNKSLLLSERNVKLSSYLLREARADQLPQLTLNANYVFNKVENQAGFLLSSRNRGLNTGFTASWNLFNGFNTRRLIKNAEIGSLISQTQFNSLKTDLEGIVAKLFKEFNQTLQILSMERENLKMAEENNMIALELFRLGSYTSIEMRQSQEIYERAQMRLIEAQYQAKLAEIELLRITGNFIK